MNSVIDSQVQPKDTTGFTRNALNSRPTTARAGVVNRTHRVVREQARVMKARRNRDRSLMAPLLICSVLLILSVAAVWTGMYQYQEAVEAVQTDVAGLDANNHALVVLLWFVPVFVAVMTTLWVRRSRANSEDEAG
jgi:hypothetical protein